MSDESASGERKQCSCCCISHEFFRAASKNPNKIAVIHASGGAQISKELSVGNIDTDKLLKERAKSLSPPVYQGDRCFTYSDVLASVDSLSARLRSILLGAVADDPHLIAHSPKGFFLSFYSSFFFCLVIKELLKFEQPIFKYLFMCRKFQKKKKKFILFLFPLVTNHQV
jgi:hypothetical protein